VNVRDDVEGNNEHILGTPLDLEIAHRTRIRDILSFSLSLYKVCGY
jgi:hypothetical protein